MADRFLFNPDILQKASKKGSKTEDADGVLTKYGMQVAQEYASSWVNKKTRDVALERKHPELVGLFYDIRNDRELATEHAIPFAKSEKPMYVLGVDPGSPHGDEATGVILEKSGGQTVVREVLTASSRLLKASLPVIAIGKRGGKIVGYSKGKPIYQGDKEGEKKIREQQQSQTKAPKKVESKNPIGKRKWQAHYRDKSYGEPMKWENGRLVESRHGEKGALIGTQQDYVSANGNYEEDRINLQKQWAATFFKDKNGNPVKPVAPNVQKTAIVLMGGPASGKTSTVKHLLGQPDGDFAAQGFVNVNPDDVKEMIPEYNHAIFGGDLKDFMPGGKYDGMTTGEIQKKQIADGTYKNESARNAAWIAHEESGDVAEMVYEDAIANNMNVVVDGTGKDAGKHLRKVQALQKAGYKVQLVMPDVDMEDAKKRSLERAEKVGRHVPIDEVLIPAHLQIPGNFETIAREADKFYLYDTRGGREKGVQLKWSGGRDMEDLIHDDRWVQEFQKRGRELQARHARMSKSETPKAPKRKPPRTFKKPQKGKSDADFLKNALKPGRGYITDEDFDGNAVDDEFVPGERNNYRK